MWLKAQGYAAVSSPTGKTVEMHTRTCGHCMRVDHIKPKMDPAEMGGLCFVCMRLVCQGCVGKGCDVIEKKLERAEASYHARRSYQD